MRTYILMNLGDFYLELERDFDGERFGCFYNYENFIHYNMQYDIGVEYKNIRLSEKMGGFFHLRMAGSRKCFLMSGKEHGKIHTYFSNEEGYKSLRTDSDIGYSKIEGSNQDHKTENLKCTPEKVDLKKQQITSIYNEKIQQFHELYIQIKDKEWFQLEFESFIEDFLYWDCFDDLYDDILATLKSRDEIFSYFIEKYIDLENCWYYVYSSVINMSLIDLEEMYPQVKKFCLSEAEILEIINEESQSINLCIWSEEEEYQRLWLIKGKDKEEELKKAVKAIYSEILDVNNRKMTEILKNKYTVEYVLEMNSEMIKNIQNFNDMQYFLRSFLIDHNFFSERELKKGIEDFFERYKKHEKEYNDFIKMIGNNYYTVKYSEEIEAKYHAGLHGEKEKFDFECMNQVLSHFYKYAYISGTTKLRPNFERIPFWTVYVKELVETFLEYEILRAENDKLMFYKVENIKDIAKEKLYYKDWKNGNSYLKCQEMIIKKKEKIYQEKMTKIRRLILSDKNFLACKNKQDCLKYLRNFIAREFEEGRDNYFYCLDAYRDSKQTVCFQGQKAKNFIEDLWSFT